MILYHVTAYRWGNLNLHQYRVYCGPDRTKAIALAENECNDRGGKYGCAVYEWNEDGTDCKRIAYFSAMMHEEPAPFHNWRIDYFERLGHLLDQWHKGTVLIADPANPKGAMKFVRDLPRPPPEILGEIERHEKLTEHMIELTRERLKRGGSDG